MSTTLLALFPLPNPPTLHLLSCIQAHCSTAQHSTAQHSTALCVLLLV